MILDKLFLTFAFTLVISLLVDWFWVKTPDEGKLNEIVTFINTTVVLISFIGFVITGILWIWF
jgi:hypothetical protein